MLNRVLWLTTEKGRNLHRESCRLRPAKVFAEDTREIHIVLDNLSAHKTKAAEQFLQHNPRVRFHFTPTYSSWLNQVELWFAKIQRDVIDRGIFTSVADLARKLRRYICAYEKSARPFRWTYTNPQRRIRTNEIAGTAH